jgi:hypothetical protein
LLAKTAQVLGNGSQCELELRSARSAQSQPAKSQDALQMSEQHLDTLALAHDRSKAFGHAHVVRLPVSAA